jgi:hypothetical protein
MLCVLVCVVWLRVLCAPFSNGHLSRQAALQALKHRTAAEARLTPPSFIAAVRVARGCTMVEGAGGVRMLRGLCVSPDWRRHGLGTLLASGFGGGGVSMVVFDVW